MIRLIEIVVVAALVVWAVAFLSLELKRAFGAFSAKRKTKDGNCGACGSTTIPETKSSSASSALRNE